jgi:HK97 family phage major capsid protein
MRQITEKPEGESGDLSEEQEQRFTALKEEHQTLERKIEREQFLEDVARRSEGTPLEDRHDEFERECRDYSLRRAILNQIPGSEETGGREAEISQELARRSGIKPKGTLAPMSVFLEKRVITTGTPATGPGSNLIATDHLSGEYIDRLRANLVVSRLGARVLNGLTGNITIPKMKGSVTAGWVAEDTALTASDAAFGAVTMTPRHCGALTEMSRNMLLQSSPDIEAIIRDDMSYVLAEAVDKEAIGGLGIGTAGPTGILSTSGVHALTIADDTLTWRDLINAVSALLGNNALTGNLGWVIDPDVWKLLRTTLKLSAEENAGAVPGFMIDDTTLAGYPYIVTTIMKPEAALFGNFNDLLIGYWSAFEILVNPYESDAYKKGNVMVRAMLTMDVAVRHPESFAVLLGIGAEE